LFYQALNFKKIVPIIKNQAVNLQTNDLMKSQRVYQILVVLMLILPARIFSQQQMPLFAQKTPHIYSEENLKARKNYNNSYSVSAFVDTKAPRPFTLNPLPIGMEVINANLTIQNLPFLTIQNLPFFCKKEFIFEKNTSVPLRVRLGSLDYVNKLEGKENHW